MKVRLLIFIICSTLPMLFLNVQAHEKCSFNSDGLQPYSETIELEGFAFTTNLWRLKTDDFDLTDIDQSIIQQSIYHRALTTYQQKTLEDYLFYKTSIISKGGTKKEQWRLIEAKPLQGESIDLFFVEVGRSFGILYLKTAISAKLDKAEIIKASRLIRGISIHTSKICGIEKGQNESD